MVRRETVVVPLESTKFEYYNITEAAHHNKLTVVPLTSSKLYKQDTIGINSLDQSGKLFIKQYDCLHETFKYPECFMKHFINQNQTLLDLTLSVL